MVSPGYQRMGIGSTMINKMISIYCNEEKYEYELEIRQKNLVDKKAKL